MVKRLFRPDFARRHAPVSVADEQFSMDERTFRIIAQITEEATQLDDPETRELWMDALRTFATTGDVTSIIEVCKWKRRVVPMDEFLFSPVYLGMDEGEVYPSVLEACHELDSDKYVEAVAKGALGTGKTTLGNIMLGRGVYKLSCMRHPQTTLGIASKSSIVFTIQSVRLTTARKAVFDEFGQYIRKSPYFMEVYPYDDTIASQMLFRQQNVSILPVSSSNTGVISMNVIGGILDEMNFMQKILKSKSAEAEADGTYDQAKRLYNTLARRRRSRFTKQGKLPGILFVISSSRYPDDFTEVKAAEAAMCGGTDPEIYVYSHSQWSAKARSTFMEEEFRVQVGNEQVRSRVLGAGEKPHPGCEVINVPMDFFNEFTKDPEGSLRDFAGATTLAEKPFIVRRDAIYEAVRAGEATGHQNAYHVEEIDLSMGFPKPILERLRLDVPQMRAAHIDLGVTRDACGLAVGHVAGTKIVERTDPDTGQKLIEIAPMIAIDAAIRIVPPPGGEIEFANVRKLLVDLRDKYHVPIEYVTMDGFQSVDSRQILRHLGFKVDYLSVDKKTDPYRTLRDALYEGRLLLPQHQRLVKELADLQYTRKGQTEMVDHRPNGTKDVADAVCGVTAFLMTRRAAWAGITIQGRTGTHLLGKPPETVDPLEPKPDLIPMNHRPSMVRKPQAPRKVLKRIDFSRKTG
jgi:hypothetical protein